MNEILTAVIPVVIIGIVCAAVLVIASKLMAVKEDKRFFEIRECLPGANCGACGYAGCDGYAKALCENADVKTNLCVPGGDSVSKQISGVLGVEYSEVMKYTAVVHCGGDCTCTNDKAYYEGIKSCEGAKLLYGGKEKCIYGCIGLGDCMNVCPHNAICIKNGVAFIDADDCVGCGLCVKTCPNGLISLVPDTDRVIVTCSNKDKGALTKKVCDNGCIGCKKCERSCTKGAVKVTDNCAVIDYEKCVGCPDFAVCAEVCSSKCITVDKRNKETENKNQ